MPQITLSDEQSRLLVQHLQNSSCTSKRSEPTDSSSESSKYSSEHIESSHLKKVSLVPKRPGHFRVIFDPDIHDVFSFTSCLRYLQPRPRNISKCLKGDAVDWYADLSAVIKAEINTCVGLWCHELEEEYRKTAGQNPVPQIPLQQASGVHQPPPFDERPGRLLAQYAPKSHVNQAKECRICKQRFVSRSQLFGHLRACGHHGRFDISPSTKSKSEQVSIASASDSPATTHEQCPTISTPTTETRIEIERNSPKYRSNSHTSGAIHCRVCKEWYASGNQLHDHLRVSHSQTKRDNGTSPAAPDNGRIATH